MLLGYNTNGLQNHRLDDALRLLADRGFAAVALTPDVQHLDPLHCTARDIDHIAHLLSTLNLTPVIETGARFVLDPAHKHEPTLMTRDLAGRQRRWQFYQRCAEIGRDLGARVLSFWTGVDHRPASDSAAWLRHGVLRTCEIVRELGLTPALEPEPGHAIMTVAQWRDLRVELGDAAPLLCLDVGHLYTTGEGEPGSVIDCHHAELAQVHVEDMRRGQHEHLPPGEGDVDFGSVRRALERVGYTGTVCFELSRSSHIAPQALDRCLTAWFRCTSAGSAAAPPRPHGSGPSDP